MYILLFLILALAAYVIFGGPKLPPDLDAVIDEVSKSDLSHVVSGETGYADSDGVQIWFESIAPVGQPKGVILLNMGLAGDGLWWPPSFIRTFTDAGYCVVRYDHRGTGMSDWMADWDSEHPYSLTDMANDATAVLDALHVEKAHLIGLSLGGMVAQEIAIHHAERVSSLTLLSTSGYVSDPDLPILSSSFLFISLVQALPILKYRLVGGAKNLIKERIAKMIMSGMEVDRVAIRETAELVIYDLRERKGINFKAMVQHRTATDVSGSRYEGLKGLQVPTLVIHGTVDKFMPIEQGRKLAELIPNAEAMWLEGIGHVFPYPNMDRISARIVSHLAR